MQRTIKKIIGFLASSALALSLFVIPVSAATEVVIGNTSTGENLPGWMFNRDPGNVTPFNFVVGSPSVGVGSLYVAPIGANAADKFIGENFVNTLITDLNTISYDFKIGAGGVDTQEEQFYMNVYANFGVSDDLKFYDCRYNVVPTVGSVAGYTTVTFDKTQAYPVTTRGGASASPFTCPAIPADMDILSPGSNIRVFSLNLGDTSTSDLGLDGYFDKVVVNKVSGITTYDFEAAVAPPTSKKQCKNDGWMTFNNPPFTSKKDCENYVKDHKKDGKAQGELRLAGPSQKIKFEVKEMMEDHDEHDDHDEDEDRDHEDDKHGLGKVEYWNYDYPGGLHYKAQAMCVSVDKAANSARFMFQIPGGHPGLSGIYVVSYVKDVDGKGVPDLYGHAATADLATAQAWCDTGVGFTPAMYSVTKGKVSVK